MVYKDNCPMNAPELGCPFYDKPAPRLADRIIEDMPQYFGESISAYQAEMPEAVYVIFDGPPSHESGRFVEVENAQGKSVSAGEWKPNGGTVYWQLGPFYTDALAKRCARLTVERDTAQKVLMDARGYLNSTNPGERGMIHDIDAALAAGKENEE